MILYGMSLVYGATGKLNLLEIAQVMSTTHANESLLFIFGMVLLIAGTGFKLAAVPFHMWAPDVYQGAPAPVTLLVSSAPKIAGLALMIRLLTISFGGEVAQWQPILIAMSLMSVFLGNLLAIAQDNLKRLLAYSAISHSGYALFGIVAATPEGYAASLYYILVYAITSAAGFGLITLLSKDGHEIENVSDLKGLNTRNPWFAFLFMLVMFSMAGVPILVGFFTKLLVLKALVDANMLWLAVVGLLFAVIGTYYYLRVVKVMYFENPDDVRPIQLSKPVTLVYSMNALALLLLGIAPSALIALCTKVFL
jgi:NADH-quinone oxidoreductase subunit N